MRFKTTLPVRVFCKANPKAISLSVFLHFHHILAQASMYVQKPSACHTFCCQTYIHTRLAINMKRKVKRVCLQNPSACEGKCKLVPNDLQKAKHLCMYVEHACMYVKLSSKRVGPIPYEKRLVFER